MEKQALTVIDWIPYDQAIQMAQVINTSGGWVEGNKWVEYIEIWSEEAKPYLEALRAEITGKNIKTNGAHHQYAEDGVPVFSDHHVALFSYRAWGDLMAAIWNTAEEELGANFSYMDFYC